MRDAAHVMEKNIKRYKARVLAAQLVSAAILVFGVGAVVAYVDPSWVGVPADQSRLYQGDTVWLLSGILFIGLGIAFLWLTHRRSKRSLWVVANTSAVDMLLTLEMEEDSDSTTYYALLRNAQHANPRWRAWVDPTFNARSLVGVEVPARVFVDPKFATPAAIKIEQGVLWANPFQRAEFEGDRKVSASKPSRHP